MVCRTTPEPHPSLITGGILWRTGCPSTVLALNGWRLVIEAAVQKVQGEVGDHGP